MESFFIVTNDGKDYPNLDAHPVNFKSGKNHISLQER